MRTKFSIDRSRATGQKLAVMENFPKIALLDDHILKGRIIESWRKNKSPLGYVSYSRIHSDTKIPYNKIFSVLKSMFMVNPYSITFNVSRYGQNVKFKLNLEKTW